MKTHFIYWIGAAVVTVALWVGFTSWRAEHDARLVAETKIVAAEANIKHLEEDVVAITAERDSKLLVLQQQKKTVTTPAAAIAAIPDLSTVPLTVHPVPDDLTRVSVDAMQLFTELNSCKQTEVKLEACEATSSKTAEIITQKDAEIVALKKKPRFWKRVGGQLKSGLFWTSLGVAIGKAVL